MENWQKTRGSLVFAEEHLSFLNPQKFPAIAFSSTTQRPLLVLSVALEREGRGSQEEKQEDQLMHQVFKCCQDSLKIPSQLAKCLVSLQPKKESEEYGDEIGFFPLFPNLFFFQQILADVLTFSFQMIQ